MNRIGSVCSGYGGLDMAVHEVFGGELAWVADNDPGAAAILAHHWPDVSNLGDLKAVDWHDVPPVDIFCAGFPCQDISYAGRGEGIQEGNRSGLWHTIADALGVLRPRLVVLENVSAIVVRRPGLDVVLGDLARLGFDAEWACVRASDVGAPHRRERWFIVAAADVGGRELQRRGVAGVLGGTEGGAEGARRQREWDGHPADHRRMEAPANAAGDRWNEGGAEPAGLIGRPDAAFGSDGTAADAASLRHGNAGPASVRRIPPTPVTGDPAGHVDWGSYEPAIRRWEHTLGRSAPRPTEPGRTGERLSPAFVEWLMGLPAGHVTAVPGLTRNAQLKALGNGVVPQQAAYALHRLLKRATATESAA